MLFREHRTRARGLADLLNWGALVEDGVILNKDGSFLAGWSYRGPDLESATEAEIGALSEHLNRAFLPLGSDWMLHADAIRGPAPGYPASQDGFPDQTTALIDEERRSAYRENRYNFESRSTLTLTWMPPAEMSARALKFLVAGSRERGVDWREQLDAFVRGLGDLEDLLSSRLHVERLDSTRLLTHLHQCVTGHPHPVAVPDVPCYLDAILASQDFQGGFEPRIGEHHIAAIGIESLPLHSEPAILDFLNHLPIAYRWSSRWLPLDPAHAERHIKGFRMKWFQQRRGLVDLLRQILSPSPQHQVESFTNRDAAAMADDADTALAEASSHAVRFGYYTPVVLLTDRNREVLDGHARTILKELRNHGFPSRLETVNAIEAYRGSLPGHGWPNVRRPMIHTRNLADLLPVTAVWSGLEHNPSPHFPAKSPALLWAAAGTSPFRLNLHSSDVGHTLVIGPTGSGKSTLLGLLTAQFFRYPGAQVFAFDKGMSAYPLAMAAGGKHFDIAGPRVDHLSFCPLAEITEAPERAWASDWLEVLLSEQGLEITPARRAEINRALLLLSSRPSRTLTDFSVQVQDREIRQALSPYTLSGPLGSLFDAETESVSSSRFQVFEVAHLMELGERVVVPLLLYLFRRIEKRLEGQPTLLVLDEAWTFLLHGLFARQIQTWLKELRKKNTAVVFATQSLADVRASDQRHVIFESCSTRIFLPNPEARSDHVRSLYEEIGLNPREIALIAGAVPKRDYYFTSPDGRRLIDLALGPVALSFLGAGDKESLRTISELVDEHGPQWPRVWLQARGLPTWAEQLEPQRTPEEHFA